jgi:hypothetical protein
VSSLLHDTAAWLESVHRHIDELDEALALQQIVSRRSARAREALEETVAQLYAEGAIIGKNAEERSACQRRLTAAERHEINEADAAVQLASERVERARSQVTKDRQTRYALQIRAAALTTASPPAMREVLASLKTVAEEAAGGGA